MLGDATIDALMDQVAVAMRAEVPALVERLRAEADERLLELLGFRQWDGYGKIGDPAVEFVSRDQELIGELRP